ncbi:MAG: PAS domain S-box protein [Blastocatellia bacterium]
MNLLRIVLPILLALSFVWALVLFRRHKDLGMAIIATTAGCYLLYDLLEFTGFPGISFPVRERTWERDATVRAIIFLVVYLRGRTLAEHAQLEEQLRLGDLTYKTLFDAANDIITIVDRQTMTFVDINRAGCEKYGYKREELIGKLVTDYSTEPEKTAETFAKAITNVPIRYYRRKDGIVFPVEVTSSAFSQNNREYFVSIVRDISDRVEAETQHQSHETQLKRHNEALGQLSRSSIGQQSGSRAALQQITEVAAQALDLDRVSIWLYDRDRTRIICQDLYERQLEEHSEGLELSASDFPAYFAALDENRSIAAHDAHSDPRTAEFSESYLTPLGIVSMLDAPIRILGNNVGVVCHEQIGTPRQWSQDEETFSASVADFVAVAIEAEEREKARRSMERLVEVMQLTTDFVGITKLDDESPFMNNGGRKMLGIGENEDVGKAQVREFLPDQAWKLYREEILPLALIDGIWAGETTLRRRDGSELTVSQVTIAHRNDEGKIEYLATIMRDISDQKRAEQALRQSEERYRALYEDNPSMYFTVDAAGIVLSVNRFGAEHLGYQPKELVGKPVLSVFHEEDKAAVAERFQACLQTPDKIVEWEFRKLQKDGSLMWVKEFVRVVSGSDGSPVVLIVCDDITERKKAEEEIYKLNSGLKESSEQMRRLAAYLQNVREQERKRISLEIHDELGLQLTNFKFELKRCSIEAAKHSPEMAQKTDSLIELVGETMKTVRRIATELRPGVLDELGLIAAIEWQAQEFKRNTLIAIVLNKNAEDISEDISIDDDRATAVFRIFQEMLTNIARHSEATKVEVRLSCDNGLLVLRVKDNGKGATESRLKNSRSLGVLGMRERAQVFGGVLTITGVEGQGTAAVLEMPLN